MGANKTYQQKGDRGRLLSESDDFKRLRRAVEKAHGDREKAIAFVCRLYNVRTLDALPGAVRGVVVALLDQ
jgi:hypothetical protein